MAEATVPTYTIIQADGLYPVGPASQSPKRILTKLLQDDSIEQEIFAPRDGQNYKLEFLSTSLWPTGTPESKPWSDIPEDVRSRIDGIMVLKIGFTEQDVELFPNLKV